MNHLPLKSYLECSWKFKEYLTSFGRNIEKCHFGNKNVTNIQKTDICSFLLHSDIWHQDHKASENTHLHQDNPEWGLLCILSWGGQLVNSLHWFHTWTSHKGSCTSHHLQCQRRKVGDRYTVLVPHISHWADSHYHVKIVPDLLSRHLNMDHQLSQWDKHSWMTKFCSHTVHQNHKVLRWPDTPWYQYRYHQVRHYIQWDKHSS